MSKLACTPLNLSNISYASTVLKGIVNCFKVDSTFSFFKYQMAFDLEATYWSRPRRSVCTSFYSTDLIVERRSSFAHAMLWLGPLIVCVDTSVQAQNTRTVYI